MGSFVDWVVGIIVYLIIGYGCYVAFLVEGKEKLTDVVVDFLLKVILFPAYMAWYLVKKLMEEKVKLAIKWLKYFVHNSLVHPLLPFLSKKSGGVLHDKNAVWAFGKDGE